MLPEQNPFVIKRHEDDTRSIADASSWGIDTEGRSVFFDVMYRTGTPPCDSAAKRQSRDFRPARRSNALLPSARTQNRRPGRRGSSRDLAVFGSAWVAEYIQEPGLTNIRPDWEAAAR